MDASSRLQGVIELSSGHVFAAGSVRAITKIVQVKSKDWLNFFRFTAVGPGFSIDINSREFFVRNADDFQARAEALKVKHEELRQEAIAKLLGGADSMEITPAELDLCRQWFDNVQDVSPQYLEKADFVAAQKLYILRGMRVPHSITGKLAAVASCQHAWTDLDPALGAPNYCISCRTDKS